MTGRQAISVSPFAAGLLAGPQRRGTAIGHGYARFGGGVIAITPPGTARMPNGIETDALLSAQATVWIGGGLLRSDTWSISAGPLWHPRPRVPYCLSAHPHPHLQPELLAGRGPGLTPLGDDILIGFLAGIALAGGDKRATSLAAARFGERTTALSGTLLRLAARGHLPEPAHALLEHGDIQPLLDFGATSGKGIALGLCLATGAAVPLGPIHVETIELPLPGSPLRFSLVVSENLQPSTLNGRGAANG